MTRICRPAARLRAFPLLPALVLMALSAAAPAAGQDADHLLISEIVTTVNRFGARFIEIVNPTGAEVALDDVYLTNGTFSTNDAGYWRLVEDTVNSTIAGGGTGGYFHGRFPAGAVIAAGDTIAVSVTGSSLYLAAYGTLPDFEVFEEGATADAVPELVEVFPGSINAGTLAGGTNAVTISSVAGSVVMYRWDGAADTMEDLDYAHWGTNQAYRVDKSGYGSYLDDTAAGSQTPLPGTAGDSKSYQRLSYAESGETSPGNGSTGHDETSEALSASWSVANQTAPAPPASWLPTAPIFGGAALEPEAPFAEEPILLTLEIASQTAVNSVVVHYSVDGGAEQDLSASAAGANLWEATIPAQAEGAVVTWWAEADNAGGGTAVHPAAAPRFVGSWTTDPAPEPGELARKLLITEVNAGVNFYPNYGGIMDLAMEFVEIHNPGSADVDLTNYYITDAISYVSGSQLYWQITSGLPSSYDLVGGGNYNDFHARFPAGYVLPAGETIVMAIGGSDGFTQIYGVEPDIELYEDGDTADDIPDMVPVFYADGGNSIITEGRAAGSDGLPRGIPELEEYYGEPLVLYHWNEGEGFVTDIDIFLWGDEKDGTYRVSFSKTGVTYTGHSYSPDTAVASQTWYQDLDTTGLKSYTRVADDTADYQLEDGSNGVGGRDETSENLPETFLTLPPTPGIYLAGSGSGDPIVELGVPAKTFLPALGENFRVEFLATRNAETKVRVFDLDGRLVYTLFDSRFDGDASSVPGYPTAVLWDGRDDNYQLVPAGMYVVHLSVVDEATGDEETRTAPVVVATRLSK
jgi:hypothetical protein